LGGLQTLNCLDIRTLATEYLEDELPPENRATFEQHIESCEKCNEWFEMLRQAIEELCELSTDELSTLTEKVLIDQFRRRKQGESESEPELETETETETRSRRKRDT
jgi:anti-sigma factor RsiW